MKTRIKVVENGLGTKEYYPQYKWWIFWRHFTYYSIFDGDTREKFYDLNDAKAFLHKKAEDHKKENSKTFLEYIKYP